MNWIDGPPPKDEGHYLLKFKSGIITSGKYREGLRGETISAEKAWRCDCCGRYAAPVAHIKL